MKLILMKVKPHPRSETIVLSLVTLICNKRAASKVDVPKSFPGGHAVAVDAVAVDAALVR